MLNYGDKTIGAYTVDSRTGVLTATSTVPTTGTSPGTILVAPSGKFAYVNDTSARTLSVYTIDASSGALTLSGTPVATGDYPRSFAIHPAGRFIYVANVNENTIWTYSIDGSSGALTSVGSPTPTGSRPAGMAVAPSGKSLFVANSSNRTISAYSIDSATGALTSVGQPAPTGMAENSLAVDPLSRFLYSANNNNGEDFTATADGSFTFANGVAEGASYSVTVTAPASQTCSVENGAGTMGTANVTNVNVTCTTSANSAFGQVCTVEVGCTGEFNVCQNFPNPDPNYYGCTRHCTVDNDCPAGSQGPKCSNQLLCRP